MNSRNLMAFGLVFVCCCAIAIGAVIERQDAGGLWSTVNSWDPNQLPTSADTAHHGTMASGTMTFDDSVPEPNRTIARFEFVEGSSRGLLIDDDMDLIVTGSFERDSGSGDYTTELGDGSTVTVGSAINRRNWILGTGAEVTAGSIALAANSDWTVNNLAVVNVSGAITRSAGAHVFTINNGGDLQAGSTANISELVINAGGNADITGQLDTFRGTIDGGTLTAASHDATSSEIFMIRNGGSVSVTGEFEIGTGSSLQYGSKSGANVDNTLACDGLDFSNITSKFEPVGGAGGSSLAVTMTGDFDVETTGADFGGFNPSGVVLTFDDSETQTLEAFSTDYDVNSVGNVWYGVDQHCDDHVYNARPLRGIIVNADVTVEVTDLLTNAYRAGGYTQDALYVDGDVTVATGGELDLGSTILYHTGSVSGNVVGTTVPSTKRCYGDFDFDGDVDLSDFALLSAQFTGGTPADDALFDGDADTDVDLTDFALFATNYQGSNILCPGSCAESGSGGGEWTVEDLADWCLENLSSGERESFAETLLAAADAAGETQESADMAELAYLITAE